jgi:hypothetical protein
MLPAVGESQVQLWPISVLAGLDLNVLFEYLSTVLDISPDGFSLRLYAEASGTLFRIRRAEISYKNLPRLLTITVDSGE